MTGARSQTIFYTVAALIALIGLADATYLTVTHLTGEDVVCGSGFCSGVFGSVYATVAGIPTAAFGVLAYLVGFGSVLLHVFGDTRARLFLTLVVAAVLGGAL